MVKKKQQDGASGQARGETRGDAPTFEQALARLEAIVQRLYAESAKILARPEVKERIGGLGYEILASTPRELEAQIQSEVSKWRRVVQQAGIKVE